MFFSKDAQGILMCKGLESAGQEKENWSVLLCFGQPLQDVSLHSSAFPSREEKQMGRPFAWGKKLNLCHKQKSSKVGVISLTN